MDSPPEKSAGDEDQARMRVLSLLEATHQFPCHYSVTVIAFNRPSVTGALLASCSVAAAPVDLRDPVAGPIGGQTGDTAGEGELFPRASAGAPPSYEARASREGKYLSHRFAVHVAGAVEVLELYARLRSVDGVVTIL